MYRHIATFWQILLPDSGTAKPALHALQPTFEVLRIDGHDNSLCVVTQAVVSNPCVGTDAMYQVGVSREQAPVAQSARP